MHLMTYQTVMGTEPRLYVHEDVVLRIEPGPKMTWGLGRNNSVYRLDFEEVGCS